MWEDDRFDKYGSFLPTTIDLSAPSTTTREFDPMVAVGMTCTGVFIRKCDVFEGLKNYCMSNSISG